MPVKEYILMTKIEGFKYLMYNNNINFLKAYVSQLISHSELIKIWIEVIF